MDRSPRVVEYEAEEKKSMKVLVDVSGTRGCGERHAFFGLE